MHKCIDEISNFDKARVVEERMSDYFNKCLRVIFPKKIMLRVKISTDSKPDKQSLFDLTKKKQTT